MRLYSNGRFKVTVHDDGSIKVMPGDWLTKYSAAMYDRFWRIFEFGRLSKNGGGIEPIKNPNLIFAGETLYHIPTYTRAHPARVTVPQTPAPRAPTPPAMSEEEKRRLALSTLQHEFHLSGEKLELVSKYLHSSEGLDTAVQLAEIGADLAHVSAGAEAVLGTIALGAGVLNAILTPISLSLAVAAAKEEGRRLLGFAAAAYAITAWSFDNSIPPLPVRIERNSIIKDPREINRDREAWKKS